MLQPSSILETIKSIAYTLKYYKNQKLVVKNYFSETIPQIEDNSALKRNCMDLNECVLFLYNANNEQARIDEFDFMMKKLENTRNKPFLEKVKFGWVNTTCHKDFYERMDIPSDKIPSIVYLFPWRTAYTQYNNYFEDFSLTEFFQKAMQGRIDTKSIRRENIYLSVRDCSEHEENENDETGLDAKVEFKGEIQEVKKDTDDKLDNGNSTEENKNKDTSNEVKKSDL